MWVCAALADRSQGVHEVDHVSSAGRLHSQGLVSGDRVPGTEPLPHQERVAWPRDPQHAVGWKEQWSSAHLNLELVPAHIPTARGAIADVELVSRVKAAVGLILCS